MNSDYGNSRPVRGLVVVGIQLFFILPIAVLLLYSFAGRWSFPALVPETFNLRTLIYLKENSGMISLHMGSSVVYALEAVGLSILFSLMPAEFLSRNEFRGKKVLESLLLAPCVLPAMTFSVGIHLAFIRAGLADTHLGVALILAVYSYPYMLRALILGYDKIGTDLSACARNLGAGYWQILWKIEIPMLLPALVAGGSIVFLVAFSDYFLVFLIGGGAVPSYAGYLFPFLNGSDWSLASGLTLLFVLPPLILFVVLDMTVYRLYRRWL